MMSLVELASVVFVISLVCLFAVELVVWWAEGWSDEDEDDE